MNRTRCGRALAVLAMIALLIVPAVVPVRATGAIGQRTVTSTVTDSPASASVANPTLTIDPNRGGSGDTVAFAGDGYMPGGAVTMLMTGDGLIVAETRADAGGAIAGSFTAPERDRLTGESSNDIPVFAIDESSGRESPRATFTYVTPTPAPSSSPEPATGRPVHIHHGTCAKLSDTPRYDRAEEDPPR